MNSDPQIHYLRGRTRMKADFKISILRDPLWREQLIGREGRVERMRLEAGMATSPVVDGNTPEGGGQYL